MATGSLIVSEAGLMFNAVLTAAFQGTVVRAVSKQITVSVLVFYIFNHLNVKSPLPTVSKRAKGIFFSPAALIQAWTDKVYYSFGATFLYQIVLLNVVPGFVAHVTPNIPESPPS